jgi:hypothetical protein
MRYRLEGQGSNTGKGKIYLFSTDLLGPSQPPIQWVPEALFAAVKRTERETEYSFPSSADDKESGAVTPLPTCLHAAR